MSISSLVLILIAISVGCLPPLQAGINATLAGHHGHPLWAALTNTLVASLVLGVALLALRVPAADLRAVSAAPAWTWIGGVLGAVMVLSAIVVAPKLGAAGYVSAMVVGTVSASLLVDHFGWVGFAIQTASPQRLLGGGLVIAGMLLVNTSR